MARPGGQSFAAGKQPVRLDLHNHTSYSSDGVMSPGDFLRTARANGLACVAITDHNTVEGALVASALAETDPSLPRVIPGIEVATADGDVIGLYVREGVSSGLPASETIGLIKRQGGLVYLPHPHDLRRGTIAAGVRERVAREADIVEVLNGRSLSPLALMNSRRLAQRHHKPGGAGSDAHGPGEVGRAYVSVESQPTRDDLVALIAAGTVRAGLEWHEYLLNWALQPLSAMTRFYRKRGRRLPARGMRP